jgi:hypothetical protein
MPQGIGAAFLKSHIPLQEFIFGAIDGARYG